MGSLSSFRELENAVTRPLSNASRSSSSGYNKSSIDKYQPMLWWSSVRPFVRVVGDLETWDEGGELDKVSPARRQ